MATYSVPFHTKGHKGTEPVLCKTSPFPEKLRIRWYISNSGGDFFAGYSRFGIVTSGETTSPLDRDYNGSSPRHVLARAYFEHSPNRDHNESFHHVWLIEHPSRDFHGTSHNAGAMYAKDRCDLCEQQALQ
jgi:hypothetical protein